MQLSTEPRCCFDVSLLNSPTIPVGPFVANHDTSCPTNPGEI